MTKNRLIALIGMPGCGKTTLGKMLAERLDWNFIDADSYIEEISSRRITALFQDGEEVFRRWETESCRRLAECKKMVIACGGGVVLRPENLASLRTHGLILFIDRPLEKIAEDIDIHTRPLLREGIEKLRKLYVERYSLYLGEADRRVENTGALEETLEELFRVVKTELDPHS